MNCRRKCKTAKAEDIVCAVGNNGFSDNHSIGYCMIGYLCAYLRYYHPYEFITAYLNNANNDDDVKNGSELAMLYGIKIVPPRFGVSKDKYLFDKEQKVIAKGIASVKYMNKNVANELYELAHSRTFDTFMDLLLALNTISIDTRQRDILIKIDYFSDFGNSKELLKIVDFFNFFKCGEMKKISKDKLNEELESIVSQYATDASKSGKPSKSYTFTDMRGLLIRCEEIVRGMHIEDFSFREKMQTQLENLGYIDLTSNKESDRRSLIVLDVFPLKSKAKNEIWGYGIQTRSIGSGKVSRLTVRSAAFNKNPIKRFDVIHAAEVQKNKAGFWYLNRYHLVV